MTEPGVVGLAPKMATWQGVCIECFASGLVLIVVLGSSDISGLRKPSTMFGLPVGFAVVVGALAAVSVLARLLFIF